MPLLILFCLLWSSLVVAADVSGSQDLAALPRFPNAQIIAYEQTADAERIYPQGSIRRISNKLRYEQSIELVGELTAITYRLPDGHAANEPFDQARNALLAADAQLLYWCDGRACGSSSLWANAVFNRSKLYGPEAQQAYMLLRLAPPLDNQLLALYSITRGNGRSYLQVEQLSSSQALGALLPTPATLLRLLKSTGELRLPNLPAEPGADWTELLARSLKLDSTVRVSLAGVGAQAWQQALLEAGVKASKLQLADTGMERSGLRIELQR